MRLPGPVVREAADAPPEVNINAWKGSIRAIRKIEPQILCPTHFGSYEDVERHLGELEQRLRTGCSSSRSAWMRGAPRRTSPRS